MLRNYLGKLSSSKNDNIKWRSHEPSRIEAFSDSVFAFAVSLSVISLEVPHTFTDFIKAMHGLMSFVICFLALCSFWFRQYKFFRRYGMHDDITIYLNCALLLMILLFIYPLKFLSSASLVQLAPQEIMILAELYGVAAAIIFLLLGLMYANAYLKKDELRLNNREKFETVTYILNNLGQFVTITASIIVLHLAGDKTNFNNNLPTLSILILLTVALAVMNKQRKNQFKKLFGNIPMTEPHLGAE